MTKTAIKNERSTPFGEIFPVMDKFTKLLGPVIDKSPGDRCTSYGYQYSEIIRSLMTIYFCGGSCIEDVSSFNIIEITFTFATLS